MEKHGAELLLQRMLSNATATFREGQWEAIDAVVNQRRKMLVVRSTCLNITPSSTSEYHRGTSGLPSLPESTPSGVPVRLPLSRPAGAKRAMTVAG
ncbi:hypothetical protein C3995_00462 [Escherichia marmotae]|jgi:hypothetical protein|uniref:Uncharacterized protein n=1 Tax=Escherichia marmotae TaxID=1499973 RepID=A0A370V1S8_9ESCH|nr:hypothetical protein C4A13_00475 [Escherichia marmotae]RDR34156.1 hypothetical protein C4A14_00453 [Escherichia marmotae]RDR35419.1 hypothetical protein C4A11_00279 [Escherichia marmotae]RDR92618.1 hypothetical protein C4A00_00280 [Escherichia marmotae]RDS17897.1 hypothetical protein C3995_00462 [Escherichia marmotae]